ncbi:hypothetical protein JCM5350_005172 [Sporobolomyces pararoseus]
MGKRSYTEYFRELVARKALEGKSLAEIVEWFEISESSVRRWVEAYEDTGSCLPPPKGIPTKPNVIEPHVRVEIIEQYRLDPTILPAELQIWLAVHREIFPSITTIRRLLDECNLTRKKLKRRAQERTQEWCEEYCESVGSYFTPEQVIYLDETGKDDTNLQRTHGYSLIGEPAYVDMPQDKGTRTSLLCAISLDGFLCGKVFEGTLDMASFGRWLITDLLINTNPFPEPKSVIILDNARVHHCEYLIEVMESFVKNNLHLFGSYIAFEDDPDEAFLEHARKLFTPEWAKNHYASTGWKFDF